MSKVYVEDLVNINNSKSIENFMDGIRISASKISNNIDLFSHNCKDLSGQGYMAVMSKLNIYKQLLDKIWNICQRLPNSVRSANNYMLTFLEGFDIDTSKLDEITATLGRIDDKIFYLSNVKIMSNQSDYDADPDNVEPNYIRPSWADDEINYLSSQKEILLKVLDKIDNLWKKDQESYVFVRDDDEDLIVLKNEVNILNTQELNI